MPSVSLNQGQFHSSALSLTLIQATAPPSHPELDLVSLLLQRCPLIPSGRSSRTSIASLQALPPLLIREGYSLSGWLHLHLWPWTLLFSRAGGGNWGGRLLFLSPAASWRLRRLELASPRTGLGGDPRLPGSALDPWLLLPAPFSPPLLFPSLPQTSWNSGVSGQKRPLPVIVPVGTLLKVTEQVRSALGLEASLSLLPAPRQAGAQPAVTAGSEEGGGERPPLAAL